MANVAPVSGWSTDIFVAVSRVIVKFECAVGNAPKTAQGTGFWIRHNAKYFFVTNKHVVDPTMILGKATTYGLASLHVELHLVAGENVTAAVAPIPIEVATVKTHATADVAIVSWPLGEPKLGPCAFISFQSDLLADSDFFKNSLHPMDIASFIGYPGKDSKDWWDTGNNFPIGRIAHIASLPVMDFANQSIETSHALLVSGFSFSGSSGSPVLLHEKGLNLGEGLTMAVPNYVGPKLLGIMSGHWQEPSDIPGMFNHTGLSYLTKSTAILELLAKL